MRFLGGTDSMRCCLPPVFALLLLTPGRSDARIVLIGNNPTVRYLGPVVNQEAVPAGPGAKSVNLSVSYQYHSVSLFRVDFWTWNGGYCLHGGRWSAVPLDAPVPLSREQAAALLDRDIREVTPPFTYRYPPGFLFVLGLLLLGVPFMVRARRARKTTRAVVRTSLPQSPGRAA
jgi:hypothetical protein